MPLPMYIIDAFTDKPFAGNPAAVCLPTKQCLTEETMQKIAAEMNLSETAFITLLPSDESATYRTSTRFGLRWFTPATEVPLCGHATLASAAVLFNCIGNTAEVIEFESLSGVLHAKKCADLITIYLPENKPVQLKDGEVQDIVDFMFNPAGSLRPIDVQFSSTAGKLLIRLPDTYTRKEFESYQCKVASLVKLHASVGIRGIIMTLRGTPQNGCLDEKGRCYDFISRYFAPWVGINEDPVTGSAHTVLAPYWSTVLNKLQFYVRQCSARGGDLDVTLNEGRVEISGASTIVLQGSINVPL